MPTQGILRQPRESNGNDNEVVEGHKCRYNWLQMGVNGA